MNEDEIREGIDNAQALINLHNNEDFQKLILKGFITDGLLQFGSELAYASEDKHIVEQLKARAILRQYMDLILNTGRQLLNERN